MKLNLLIFGGSSALVVVCFVIGHALIETHIFTVMAGWAIFIMGVAFGLSIALAVMFYEMIVRRFKSKIANPPKKKGRQLRRPFHIGTTLYVGEYYIKTIISF